MILFGSRDEIATATSRKLICDCNKFVTVVLCQHLIDLWFEAYMC
jgi:hypothetical protein